VINPSKTKLKGYTNYHGRSVRVLVCQGSREGRPGVKCGPADLRILNV